jgi:hypothetical protein
MPGRCRRVALLLVLLPIAPLYGQTANDSAQASLAYLRVVMDQFHNRFPVYDDVSSAGNHFHVFAKIPDAAAPVTMNGSWTGTIHSGATAIRCQFTASVPYAGFYLQNGTLTGSQTVPQANWGTVADAGIDLSGATALTFWARGESGGEKIDFFLAGVGRDAEFGFATAPHPDSSPRLPSLGSSFTLTTSWQQYTISLTGADLTYVLGGFAWVATSDDNPSGATFFLDDIQYELGATRLQSRLGEKRFLRSFTTLPLQPDPTDQVHDGDIDFVMRNLAFTYDNAVAVLAFLADGSTDSVRRARLIGDAFVYATQHDRRYNDSRTCSQTVDPLTDDGARLRSAYAAGDIALPNGWRPNGRAGTVPIPGYYYEPATTFYEIEQDALDTGNNAWAILALRALYDRTAETSYRDTACKLANFAAAFRQTSGSYQGFTGGVNAASSVSPSLRQSASSEHNIDLYAAFSGLYRATGDTRWRDDADHARQFVEAMWDSGRNCYLAGTSDPSTRKRCDASAARRRAGLERPRAAGRALRASGGARLRGDESPQHGGRLHRFRLQRRQGRGLVRGDGPDGRRVRARRRDGEREHVPPATPQRAGRGVRRCAGARRLEP